MNPSKATQIVIQGNATDSSAFTISHIRNLEAQVGIIAQALNLPDIKAHFQALLKPIQGRGTRQVCAGTTLRSGKKVDFNLEQGSPEVERKHVRS